MGTATGQQPMAYRRLLESGELAERVSTAREQLWCCHVCPRHCEVNRLEGEQGFCKVGDWPFVARYGPHFGEEAPQRGHSPDQERPGTAVAWLAEK